MSSLVVLASSYPSLQTPMLFSKHTHHPSSDGLDYQSITQQMIGADVEKQKDIDPRMAASKLKIKGWQDELSALRGTAL